MPECYLRNRQRERRLNLELLRTVTAILAAKTSLNDAQLGVVLVNDSAMTRLNETFLNHAGSTDVITFNYAQDNGRCVEGEVFVCVNEAERQARRFKTTWQQELVRYILHGFLHLQGYDDVTTAQRVRMKTVENRLLREMVRKFPLHQLSLRTAGPSQHTKTVALRKQT